jgi:hypothetical protein
VRSATSDIANRPFSRISEASMSSSMIAPW